jgi:KUP system potassium uptake protein
VPLKAVVETLRHHEPERVAGTAVYMTRTADQTPTALIQNVHTFRVLHERVIILTVRTEIGPYCRDDQRVHVHPLDEGIYLVDLHYGFMEEPDVPRGLELAAREGLKVDLDSVVYVLGRELLLAAKRPGMAIWREKLFTLMARNSRPASYYFGLPPDRVVEVGTQVEL